MTYIEAVDELFGIFNDMWEDPAEGAEPIVGYVPEVRWPGVEEPDKPNKSKFWTRVSQQTLTDEQSAFCGEGSCNFTNEGLLMVELFCPKSTNTGVTKGRELSIIIRNAYRCKNTSSGLWFRSQKITELDPEAHFYRFMVTVEYQFDEKD